MSRKGSYNGGSTVIGPKDHDWFSPEQKPEGSYGWPPEKKPGALEIVLADYHPSSALIPAGGLKKLEQKQRRQKAEAFGIRKPHKKGRK